MVADSPTQQVDVLMDETLWPGQPLGRDVAGSAESVAALTREGALHYLRRQYVPNNAVLSVAGAVERAHVLELASAAFGDWSPGLPVPWYPALNGQREPGVGLKHKETEQAHLQIALRGLSLGHPNRYALSLLSVILGEGMSSRLALELRERRSLCYDVHSYTSFFQDAGTFTVYAGVDPARAHEALSAIVAELARLRDEPPPDEELARAKELAKGRLLLRMEDTRAVADWLGAQELLAGRIRAVDEVAALLDAVTPAGVQRIARSIIAPERFNLAVVGPFQDASAFRPLLRL